jgi:hypothetical protein
MAQSYWYVPGVLNVKVYVVPLPLNSPLLEKVGDPSERTVCAVDPVLFRVQVTVVPTATVSMAGFWVSLFPLLKKMFPIVTVPGVPPSLGALSSPEQPAAAAAAAIRNQLSMDRIFVLLTV